MLGFLVPLARTAYPFPFTFPFPFDNHFASFRESLTNMSSSSVLIFDAYDHHFFDAAEQKVRIHMADNVLFEVLYNPSFQRVILMDVDSHKNAYAEFKDPYIRLVDVLHFMGIDKAHVGIMWVDPSFHMESVDASSFIEKPVYELPLSQIVVIPYTSSP